MRWICAITMAAALAGHVAADGSSVALAGAMGNKYLVEDPDDSPLGSFGLAPEYRRTFHDRHAWAVRGVFLHTSWGSPKFYRKQEGRLVPGSDFTGSIQSYEAWGRHEFAWTTGRLGVLSGLALGLAFERVDVEWEDPASGPVEDPESGKFSSVFACAAASPIILRWEARPGLTLRVQPEIGVNEFHGLGTLRSGGEDAFLLLWLGVEYGL